MIKLRKTLPWLLVIFWMTVIFYLSHQPGVESSGLSTGITEAIIRATKKIAPSIDFNLEVFNHVVRKNAHFFAYLVLGILVANGLRSSGVVGLRAVVIALGISVLYAISDEAHQLFVPGRAGQVKDVFIDSAGAVFGIGLYEIFKYIKSKQTKC